MVETPYHGRKNMYLQLDNGMQFIVIIHILEFIYYLYTILSLKFMKEQ